MFFLLFVNLNIIIRVINITSMFLEKGCLRKKQQNTKDELSYCKLKLYF